MVCLSAFESFAIMPACRSCSEDFGVDGEMTWEIVSSRNDVGLLERLS